MTPMSLPARQVRAADRSDPQHCVSNTTEVHIKRNLCAQTQPNLLFFLGFLAGSCTKTYQKTLKTKYFSNRRRGADRALARNADIPRGRSKTCEASWRRVLFFSAGSSGEESLKLSLVLCVLPLRMRLHAVGRLAPLAQRSIPAPALRGLGAACVGVSHKPPPRLGSWGTALCQPFAPWAREVKKSQYIKGAVFLLPRTTRKGQSVPQINPWQAATACFYPRPPTIAAIISRSRRRRSASCSPAPDRGHAPRGSRSTARR